MAIATTQRRVGFIRAPVKKFLSVMLEFLILWDGGRALFMMVESPNRYSSATFSAAKTVMPIKVWGILLMVCTLITLTGRQLNKLELDKRWRLGIRGGTFLGFCFWMFWGTLSLESAYHTGQSSFAGGYTNYLIAILHTIVCLRGG